MESRLVQSEFHIEIQFLIRLKHPNIISIIGWGTQKGRIFIVLEPLSDIGDGINSSGLPYSDSEQMLMNGLNICKQLASVITYLHHQIHPSATIIHRDLKIQNIGMGSDQQLKLFDFGLAKCIKRHDNVDELFEMTGGTGTLRYMPPEVAMYQPYNEKVDVFSFGIVMWTILTKRTPFAGYDRNKHYDRVVLGGERPLIPETWPLWLRNLLDNTWAPKSEQRPSIDVVLQVLEANVVSSPTTTAVEERVKVGNGCCFKRVNRVAYSSTTVV